MNPDTMQSVLYGAQEAMGARRVVKRDHLGVVALELNSEGKILKKDKKVYGKAKKCELSWEFSAVLWSLRNM